MSKQLITSCCLPHRDGGGCLLPQQGPECHLHWEWGAVPEGVRPRSGKGPEEGTVGTLYSAIKLVLVSTAVLQY